MPTGTDIIGGALQAGLPILGGLLGGPAGIAGGGLLGQLGEDITQYFGQTETPEDRARAQLLQRLQGTTPFQRVGFDPIAQQEIQRFQQQTIPGLAERFTGMGGQRSSAFRQQLGAAGSNLAERLAALGAQHAVGQQGAQLQHRGLEQQRMGALQNYLAQQQAAQQQQRQSRLARYMPFLQMLPQMALGQQQQGLQAQLMKAQQAQQVKQQGLSQFQGLMGLLQQGDPAQVQQLVQAVQGASGQQFIPTQQQTEPGFMKQLGQTVLSTVPAAATAAIKGYLGIPPTAATGGGG